LETLQPAERAVFLLREVFNYDYADVAVIVGKSEANCRQIVRRAKAKLAENPPATPPPTGQARRMVAQFMEATATGRVGDLLSLLAEDAILYTDGGRLKSARQPIYNADRISRFFLGIQKRQPADTAARIVWINGRIGVLLSSGGQIYNATAFDLEGERVRSIYIIRNPEKLRHLSNLIYVQPAYASGSN
jgi:RNA polymerase sigma-70 factor (ECF subfamily)